MTPNLEELALSVDVVEWSFLRAHLQRGGLILVDVHLDLIEVATKVVNNDTGVIEDWITTSKIYKPSNKQIKTWDENALMEFKMLIVSPYVLIQEQIILFN